MRKLMITAFLALSATAANAIPVRFDFTLALSSVQGTQPGSGTANGSGFVVFDDALAAGGTPGGVVGDMSTPLPTLDLAFDWLGMHFDESTGTLGRIYLNSLGGISGWSIDAFTPSPGCTFQCVQWGSTDFNVLAANGGGSAPGTGIALLTQAGVNGVAIGNVSWTKSVPEPATLGLMLMGVAGAALRRRKLRQA
jgi:hypothetical protein